MKIHQSQSLTSLHLEILESSETVTRLLRSQFGIVKPKSKSQIPCPNRPQIQTLRSDQVYKTQKPNSLDWADTIITWATTPPPHP